MRINAKVTRAINFFCKTRCLILMKSKVMFLACLRYNKSSMDQWTCYSFRVNISMHRKKMWKKFFCSNVFIFFSKWEIFTEIVKEKSKFLDKKKKIFFTLYQCTFYLHQIMYANTCRPLHIYSNYISNYFLLRDI